MASGSITDITSTTTNAFTSMTTNATTNTTTSTTTNSTVLPPSTPASAEDNVAAIAGATVGTVLALVVLAAGVCWWKRRALSIAVANFRAGRAMDKRPGCGSSDSDSPNLYVYSDNIHPPDTSAQNLGSYSNVLMSTDNEGYETIGDTDTVTQGRVDGHTGRPSCPSVGYVAFDDHTGYTEIDPPEENNGSEYPHYSVMRESIVWPSATPRHPAPLRATPRPERESHHYENSSRDSVSAVRDDDSDGRRPGSSVTPETDIDSAYQSAGQVPDTNGRYQVCDNLTLGIDDLAQKLGIKPTSTTCISTFSTKVLQRKLSNQYEAVSNKSTLPTEISNDSALPTEVLSNESTHETEVISNESTLPTEVAHYVNESINQSEILSNESNLPTEIVSNEYTLPTEVLYNDSTYPTEISPNDSLYQLKSYLMNQLIQLE